VCGDSESGPDVGGCFGGREGGREGREGRMGRREEGLHDCVFVSCLSSAGLRHACCPLPLISSFCIEITHSRPPPPLSSSFPPSLLKYTDGAVVIISKEVRGPDQGGGKIRFGAAAVDRYIDRHRQRQQTAKVEEIKIKHKQQYNKMNRKKRNSKYIKNSDGGISISFF